MFDFGLIVESVPFLVKGAVYTVQVSVLAIVFGLVLGWAFGLIAVSGVRWLRAIAWAYVQFIRGTPLLVQIFLIYFGLPVLGVNIPAYWSGVIALGLNSGGFQAEIVRAGIESIDRGQTEAARSIGMSSLQTLLFILVPQTVRRVIPPLTNELITLTKSSSLLSAIAVLELTHAGQAVIARTFAPFEIYAAVAVLYLILIAVLSRGSALLERRVFVNY
ncbi:MAG TPA: amino acid ABC transporter permease [Methylomirabilota bacterium]